MYKVLLVDDESIIVEGLTRIVPWEKYGCRVIGTANDGITGAQAIREQHPDIVFTDIRMPGVDGLTMLAGLKSEYPNMQITVLTGYRDFTYAQQAIRLGVSRFLLKPSKMNELEEALEAMTEVLKRREEQLPPAEDPQPQDDSREDAVEGDDAAGSFLVRQAVAYIEEHFTERINLSDVADKCYISQWHLSRLLHRHTNRNFYEILNQMRVNRAKELMCDPALRIFEISDMLGYSEVSHFSRVFKKLEGVSANEYRNSLTAANREKPTATVAE